ncbi:HAD-like domain-containing protein [Haematococcus lacustris]|uniref:FCP1 homology domain-containing protein n=1 Tax=Haematococcus lacustris TaxID=44745 RepID=A0A699Y5R6_HAELA|nr:FCP1 homology domain-containing protein [Haematococcus lacustris]
MSLATHLCGQPSGDYVPLHPKQDVHDVSAADIASVITQVTVRDVGASPVLSSTPLQQASWQSQLRCLLCCFVPDKTGGYVKTKAEAQMAVVSSPRASAAPPALQMIAREREHLIGPKIEEDLHKKTLVLDLDETLVHSSFKPIPSPDYIIPVEIDGKLVDVYVLKRPWLDHFMEAVGSRFEVVVFTASLSKYADPLLDLMDKHKVIRWRLFRESCLPYEGNYVKDLSCMGRDLQDIIIVDNSPHSYVFQPANAMPCRSFIDDLDDQELLELLPILQEAECAPDVRQVLQKHFPTAPQASSL